MKRLVEESVKKLEEMLHQEGPVATKAAFVLLDLVGFRQDEEVGDTHDWHSYDERG